MSGRKILPSFPLLLFLTFIVLDSSVDLTQRAACGESEGDGLAYYLQILRNPWFVYSILVPLIQLPLWTRILKRVDLSLASPLTSLSYPVTVWIAHVVFHESVDWRVWAGAFLIVGGVTALGQSEAKAEREGAVEVKAGDGVDDEAVTADAAIAQRIH